LNVRQASFALVGNLTEGGWGEIKTEKEEDEYGKNVGRRIRSLIALASTAAVEDNNIDRFSFIWM